MKVSEIMTKNPITVLASVPIKDVAAILVGHGISGLPVVSNQGEILGVVSEGDILFKERGPSRHRGLRAWLHDQYGMEGQSKSEARTAAEAMTSPAKTIAAHCSASAAAGMMLAKDVHRLPVVDANDKLVGIVTRADLVRAFARPDEALAAEIEELLERSLWVAPGTISVAVDHGDVCLTGAVQTEAEADVVAGAVEEIPGVMSLDCQLSWRLVDGI